MNERYVYLKNGDAIVLQQHFSCESEKQKIIEKWKKLYGKKFSDLTIEEDPKGEKVKQKKSKASAFTYGHIMTTGKKNFKGFIKSWNGYKD